MTHTAVTIQVDPVSVPSTPSWMGEVAAVAQVLTHVGLLNAIQDHVQFARARFGAYDTIDFVVVLIGYALSGEPTLLAFYERLLPFSETFMALFGRSHLPSRSALSRFLAALDQTTVEALRTQFQDDLLKRTSPFPSAFRVGGSSRATVCGRGCRWYQASRSPTCAPPTPIATRTPSTFRSGCSPRVQGAEERGSRANPHHDFAGAYASIHGHIWGIWQWQLPGRIETNGAGSQQLCDDAQASSFSDSGASGWLVWPTDCATS